jgi:tRNA-splicing ligase RtcB
MQEFDTRIRLFLSGGVALDAASREKIERMLSLADIRHIAVLPDVHSKPDNPVPTGIVTLTKNTIYAFAIGQEVGCGVRILKTPLTIDDLDARKIESIFAAIKGLLRDNLKKQPFIGRDEYIKILLDGYAWAKENFSLERRPFTQNRGLGLGDSLTMLTPQEALRVIPRDAFRAGLYRLGALGGGNHFLELQVVDTVFEKRRAAALGLEKGDLLFMFHTGAGVFSKRIDNYYGIRYQRHRRDKYLRSQFRKALYHFNDFRLDRLKGRWQIFFAQKYRGIDAASPEARRYLALLNAAFNYSFVNRCFISQFISESVNRMLGRTVELEVIADIAHERIDLERLDGESFWVHRNGACRAEGEVLPLPGFPGGPSFLCAPGQGLSKSFYSLNHGAGRVLSKAEAKDKFSQKDIVKDFEEKQIKLYKLGDENVSEQAPLAFKDINAVIETLKGHSLINPILSTKPLAIIKG